MAEVIKNNIAYIIKSIGEISGKSPGKKRLQKLVYLIEQKGVDLNFNYGLHFYGPYSSDLDAETTMLSMDGIVVFEYSKYAHKMSIGDNWDVQADLSQEQEEIIEDVILRFKDQSPGELELLSTAIYVYDNLSDKSKNSIINGVKKIKGSKYTSKEIENAIDDFVYFGRAVY